MDFQLRIDHAPGVGSHGAGAHGVIDRLDTFSDVPCPVGVAGWIPVQVDLAGHLFHGWMIEHFPGKLSSLDQVTQVIRF